MADSKAKATAESDAKLADLNQQLSTSSARADLAETRSRELEALVDQLEKENQKNASADAATHKATLDQNQRLRTELAELQTDIKHSAAQIAQLEKALASSQNALTDLTNKSEGTSIRITDLEKAAEQAAADAFREAELRMRAQASTRAAEERTAQSAAELDAAIGRQTALEQERNAAISRLEELEAARDAAADNAHQAIAQRDAAKAELQTAQDTVARLKSQQLAETAATVQAAEEIRRLTEQSRKLMTEIDAKNGQIAEAIGLKEKVETASSELATRLKTTEQALAELRGANQGLEHSKTQLENSLTRHIADLGKLRGQIEALRTEREQVEGQAERLKQRVIQIDPVRYNRNSSNVSDQQQRVLSRVQEILEIFPQASFEIIGHTCDIGPREGNLQLSLQRAENLASFLEENGIDVSKLSTRGIADDQPIVPNDSEENRRLNRRVEIIFHDSP
jgi:outer membrane protein OmpA-like peptidoglycan-associated protein